MALSPGMYPEVRVHWGNPMHNTSTGTAGTVSTNPARDGGADPEGNQIFLQQGNPSHSLNTFC